MANSLYTYKNTISVMNAPNRETRKLWDGITEIASSPDYDGMALSVRQVYYQCVVRGKVPTNSSREYRRVQRAVLQMRRHGELPWGKIRDGTRERNHFQLYESPEDAIAHAARYYRQDVMARQFVHVELWVEKEGLLGFLQMVANDFGLPYAALKGQPSDSFQQEAGEDWCQIGKPVVVIYAGDFDSSGYFIGETLQDRLLQHYAAVTVEHIGLNADLVKKYDMPPAFEAKKADKRTPEFIRRFGKQCYELDAIKPDELRRLYRDKVMEFVNMQDLNASRREEALHRETLDALVRGGLPVRPRK